MKITLNNICHSWTLALMKGILHHSWRMIISLHDFTRSFHWILNWLYISWFHKTSYFIDFMRLTSQTIWEFVCQMALPKTGNKIWDSEVRSKIQEWSKLHLLTYNTRPSHKIHLKNCFFFICVVSPWRTWPSL